MKIFSSARSSDSADVPLSPSHTTTSFDPNHSNMINALHTQITCGGYPHPPNEFRMRCYHHLQITLLCWRPGSPQSASQVLASLLCLVAPSSCSKVARSRFSCPFVARPGFCCPQSTSQLPHSPVSQLAGQADLATLPTLTLPSGKSNAQQIITEEIFYVLLNRLGGSDTYVSNISTEIDQKDEIVLILLQFHQYAYWRVCFSWPPRPPHPKTVSNLWIIWQILVLGHLQKNTNLCWWR